MGTPAEDIAQYLVDGEIFSAVGTDIYIGQMPDTPDTSAKVTPTTGRPPVLVGEAEIPGLQITVRNSVFQTGYDKINDVMKQLHRTTVPEITGTTRNYYFMEALGSPSYIGMDEKQRHLFTLNILVYTDMAWSD